MIAMNLELGENCYLEVDETQSGMIELRLRNRYERTVNNYGQPDHNSEAKILAEIVVPKEQRNNLANLLRLP